MARTAHERHGSGVVLCAVGHTSVVGITLSELTDYPTPRGGTTALTAQLDRERAATLEVLRCGGPTMVFQPVVGLPGGAPVGVEALARFGVGEGEDPASWFARAAKAVSYTHLTLPTKRIV